MTAFLRLLAGLVIYASLPAWGQTAVAPLSQSTGFSTNGQPPTRLPEGAILVKGPWSSASDSETPVPEGGSLANGVYTNRYFALSFPLPADWRQKSAGPPPSDSGSYVLTLLRPADISKGARASILVTAQDMFFTPLPVANALDLINYSKSHLQADYKLELEPTQTKIAGRSFTSFAYWSPSTELHWRVLATEIRCHTLEFLFMSRDPKTLDSLVQEMNKLIFPAAASPAAGAEAVPVCVKNYATGENVTERVDPSFTEHKYNPVPLRIIIDKQGKVRYIHFLSAFPDQANAITDALAHWKFRPYLRDGKPVEVETGIMFARAPHHITMLSDSASALH
ncbi:MAG TPA: hypothetical protein VHU83_05905 [Bryobacteraceae bacterium]|jgi:hypothetical protein|nr:hypothetical protein [Bryobacteraceae bacterium]